MRAFRPLAALLASLLTLGLVASAAVAATVTVTNGTQFRDTGGAPVHAHGGGVLKVGSYYYWFGEDRNADDSFRYVSVYRSTDLVTWEFRNHVLTEASAPELDSGNIERPKVIYNASTGRFVMWMHKEQAGNYSEARVAVASSATVDGTYTYHGSFRPLGHMSRDLTLFNDNGTAYLVSAARDNYDLHIYRLTSDYLGIDSLVANPWPGGHREAPAVFKRGSVYFMLTSGATGWSPNQAKYATATSLAGPWSGFTNVGDGTTFGSQPTYVLPVQGTSTTSYLYLGDRWAGAWGGAVQSSQYVWLPIAFPSATSMSLTFSPQITVDTATGVVAGVASTHYRLTNRNSGKVADVSGSSGADSANVLQWQWTGGLNQQWRFEDAGNGYYRIVNRNSGKCLDVVGGSTADRADVVQYTCNGGANQQWLWQAESGGYSTLRARHSGKCLEVLSRSTADGGDIVQYACNGGTNQQWTRSTT
ncbi:beta-xylosidase [Cellulomonas sp. Root485]|uniref:RICIN domain-containing protein n=1 Tax=Cellulomonas sp. Root485 TaxID=1736546 RepID=UPI0006F7E676|nr:RICIN domain-containing protein [Cellulomonas sp. Root485]KQY21252.1 beta-xylosidase [Cellulomonas sp. Root485]